MTCDTQEMRTFKNTTQQRNNMLAANNARHLNDLIMHHGHTLRLFSTAARERGYWAR